MIARGYGARRPGELNDELELVRARLPKALVYAGKDRLALTERAALEGARLQLRFPVGSPPLWRGPCCVSMPR